MNKKIFLKSKFSDGIVEKILKEQNHLLKKMIDEQKSLLSENQYTLAKKRILERISFFLALRTYVDDDKALEYLKEYYYKKVKGAKKLMNILGSTQIGCNLFQKMFASGLKKDTWVSEIKQNNKEGLVFDVSSCLYKNLCDYYNCPKCCLLFCDGDWEVFGKMKKIKFERDYTLGQGDSLCDFHYIRKK